MSDASEPSRLERIITLLEKHRVKYMVIGGQAEYLFGSPRITYDVDICYQRSRENYGCIANMLLELKPSLRGAPADLAIRLDARAIEMGDSFTLSTNIIDLDLLGYVAPIGTFDDLIKRAETYDLAGTLVKTIALNDLIRVKQHINRSKDRDSLYQLLAIKRIREERND